MTYPKRVLICSLVAIASGLGGSYLGGQLNLTSRTNQCQTNQFGFQVICSFLVTPDALFRGSINGLWTGTILGAFMAGLATRSRHSDEDA